MHVDMGSGDSFETRVLVAQGSILVYITCTHIWGDSILSILRQIDGTIILGVAEHLR